MERSILLIDDDIDEYLLLADVLREVSGVHCSYACNAASGMEMMQRQLPDIVMLDMNMPRMNGLECLTEMKKCDTLSKVPVVIYSTNVTDGLSRSAIEKGALECIRKPRSLAGLREVMASVLSMIEIAFMPLQPGNNNKTQSPRRDGFLL